MNDLQLHICQLLQEMDSSEDTPEGVDKARLAQPAKDQIEEVKIENVKKSKGKSKEKFLTLSSKPITLGKRTPGQKEQKIEEKPGEVEHLLHIVTETETPRGVDKSHLAEPAKESIKDKE